jgi:hypothetical protein
MEAILAAPVTIKGGKVRVLLSAGGSPETFAAPCGFTSRSITFTKALNDFSLPDCSNPDSVDWLGRDAVSLSMSVSGEGVLAADAVETWMAAWEDVDSVGVKIEIEFPATTHTWTGLMHVESLEVGAQNGQRVTLNVSMQSDGEMTRVSA